MTFPAPMPAPSELSRWLVVVPAYNEAASIATVLDDLAEHVPQADVVVIDDGSADDTAAVARSKGSRVIRLPFNLGIGGAVQTGLIVAERGGYDVVVQVDGDGQHRADQVGRLVEALAAKQLDLAIGSRFLERGDSSGRSPSDSEGYRVPPLRRLGIKIFEWVNSALIGHRITDNTSGFRAYRKEAAAFLAGSYPDDYPEPESVVLLTRRGFRVGEVSVLMRGRQGGRSSIGLAQSIYYMVKVLLAILVNMSRR